ncbi:MAG: glycosyltransferase family 4 protein [Candidatus Aenigmatarchaeota archaeon]
MKKIRVYIQKPWRYTKSYYYVSLTQFPPKNIEFINKNEFKSIKAVPKYANFLKRFLKKIIKIIISSFPNVRFTKIKKSYDLIHCAHCLSLNKFPWVADIEWVGQFWLYGPVKKYPSKGYVKKILASPYCKKIMAWTEWAKCGILKEFPMLKNKIEVVYPAIPFKKFKRRKSKKITLLFVARDFYFKGGLYALYAIDALTKKYKEVNGIIISNVPENIKNSIKNKKIKFYDLMSQKKLFKKIYPKCDIFVYPSFTDTFGYSIIEAMSFGIPVVTVDGQSRRELIKNGKHGFIVKSPFGDFPKDDDLRKINQNVLNNLIRKIELLIKNKKLREKMSKNCIREVREGKFSIKERNKKLEKIYKEALLKK